MTAAVLNLLKHVALLEGVDDGTLGKLVDNGSVVRFNAGDYVVRQGDFGDSFFVVLSGKALVQVTGDDGRAREVDQLSAGASFGELAVVGYGERSASVKCVTAAELLELRTTHFELFLKKYKQVKARVEAVFQRQTLSTFVRQSRYFRELPEAAQRDLVVSSSLIQYSKGDVIAREGEPAQRLFVVRAGFVRIGLTVHQGEEVLAYLGPEDFFGDQEVAAGGSYAATAVALEPVECMAVPRSVVYKIYSKHPEVFNAFRRYQVARSKMQEGVLASNTSMGFVRDMLEAGLGQARSALIINMDACVRCGNCVQACDDLHGYSRLARRGKKMTRRKELDKREHESLYFPTSCLQCASPECMVGCPTGAIARDPGGEVYIKDTCIGCGNCARNCDFGNIQMAKVKEEAPSLFDLLAGEKAKDPEEDADLIAVKCDVCFERNFAACVYNCPTTAIMRVDPRNYFEELQKIAPKAVMSRETAPAEKSGATRANRWLDPVLQISALLASSLGAWMFSSLLLPTSWSGPGLWAGVASLVLMLLLALMGVRKRLRTQQLGPLAVWARFHAIAGGLLYGMVLFHSGFQATSMLTGALFASLTLSVFAGIGGGIASAIVPRILSKGEDEALLPEDVAPRTRELLASNTDYLASLNELSKKRVMAQVDRLRELGWSLLFRGVSTKELPALLEKRAKKLPRLLDSEHAVAMRVAENMSIASLFGARRALEILLISWLPLHLVATAMTMMLLCGHLMTVLLW